MLVAAAFLLALYIGAAADEVRLVLHPLQCDCTVVLSVDPSFGDCQQRTNVET